MLSTGGCLLFIPPCLWIGSEMSTPTNSAVIIPLLGAAPACSLVSGTPTRPPETTDVVSPPSSIMMMP